MRSHGFTLLELLITMTIMVLLVTVAMPNLSQQIQHNRTKTAANTLLNAIHLARHTAVSSNRRITLRHLGSWGKGWEMFADANDNGIHDMGEDLLFRQDQPLPGVTITGNRPTQTYVSFTGTGESRKATGNPGGAFLAGTLTVCSINGNRGYDLVLSRGGRVRFATARAGRCTKST